MEVQEIISSGLLELYAAGATSVSETLQVQEYIKKYPEVAAELSAIEESIEKYAAAFPVQPAPTVKEKIFAQINAGNNAVIIPFNNHDDTAKVVPISAFWKNSAAAAAVLLLGSVVINILQYNKNNTASNELQKTQQELASMESKAKETEQDMQVVQSKYSMPVSLNGLEAAPDAAAKIFWMKNTGDVYIDPSNLPDAPEGKQYQLWAIVEGKPVDAGMILTSKKGAKYHIQKMKTFGKVDAFAVTLESEVGNTAPKGPMYVMGKM